MCRVTPDSCAKPVCENNAELCPDETICAPTTATVFARIDAAVVIAYTIDFLLRLLLIGTMETR
jgi:hypothetical protein